MYVSFREYNFFQLLGNYINNSLHSARKHARIFVRGHYLKTVNFKEQVMSKDKYPAPNGGYCVYYPSNLFRNARGSENWGIFSNIPQLGNVRSRDVFRPIAPEQKYLMDNNIKYN